MSEPDVDGREYCECGVLLDSIEAMSGECSGCYNDRRDAEEDNKRWDNDDE